MSQLRGLAFLIFTTSQILFVNSAAVQSEGQDSQNSTTVYDKLCQNSANSIRSAKFTLKTLDESMKWYFPIGNDIARQKFASFFKGQQLSKENTKDYEGMCYEANKPFAQLGKIGIGSINAFGKLSSSVFNCAPNGDLPASFRCLLYNVATMSHFTDIYHVVDIEAENVYLIVDCFSNKDVGWHVLTQSSILTKEESTAVIKQVVALGFNSENTVEMHDGKCQNI